jgi:hypothetical protein
MEEKGLSTLDCYKLNFKYADVFYIPNSFSGELASVHLKSILNTIKFVKKKRKGE